MEHLSISFQFSTSSTILLLGLVINSLLCLIIVIFLANYSILEKWLPQKKTMNNFPHNQGNGSC